MQLQNPGENVQSLGKTNCLTSYAPVYRYVLCLPHVLPVSPR
jgi:hypothetical protein